MGWPRKSGWIAGTPLGLVPLAATLRMRCFICCLTRRCSAVAAGVRLTETTRERKKDYKFKLRTWGVLVGVITCVDSECFIHLFYFLYLKYIFVHKFLQCYIKLA